MVDVRVGGTFVIVVGFSTAFSGPLAEDFFIAGCGASVLGLTAADLDGFVMVDLGFGFWRSPGISLGDWGVLGDLMEAF